MYDLQEDPHELRNLAGEPKLRKVLREHSRKLDQWVKATGDKGETAESPAVIAHWQAQMAEYWKQRMAKRELSPDISDEDYLKWWEEKLLG